jgi:hypothetical protein
VDIEKGVYVMRTSLNFAKLACTAIVGAAVCGMPTGASAKVKTYFAAVDADGTFVAGTAGTKSERDGTGFYRVTFKKPVDTDCFYTGSHAYSSPPTTPTGGAVADIRPITGDSKALFVTTSSGGVVADREFHLIVFCE